MKKSMFNNQKYLWILGGILLVVLVCGLFVWLGGDIVEIAKSHLGM